MVGENFETFGYEIPKNAMKSHEQFMFDNIISSNSTMVVDIFENVDLEIPKSAMKPHNQLMFDHSIPSNSTMRTF